MQTNHIFQLWFSMQNDIYFFWLFHTFLLKFSKLNLEAVKSKIVKLDMEELWCMKDYTCTVNKKNRWKPYVLHSVTKETEIFSEMLGPRYCTGVHTCMLPRPRISERIIKHTYVPKISFVKHWFLGLNSRKADIHYVCTTGQNFTISQSYQ